MSAPSSHRHVWTIDTIHELGVTTDVETAAAILGIGRTLAYELIKTNQFPVRVLRMGRRVSVPVAPLLRLVQLGTGNGD